MCGFFGIVLPANRQIERSLLQDASRQLRHRGPDDEGYLLASAATGSVVAAQGTDSQLGLNLPSIPNVQLNQSNVGLVFRRLSILDLSIDGHQPMRSANGHYWIAFNGEIYNFIELRQELVALGHVFRTRADTEVLLAAFCEWGSACFTRLEGMFALLILDSEKRQLYAARDHFGIKPLYFARYQDGFVFASEAKILLSLPGLKRTPNATAVHQYLRFGERTADQSTLLLEIKQVPAAHWGMISLEQPSSVSFHRYWDIPSGTLDVSESEARTRVAELFHRSIRLHLRSDVPVGVCLSGGLDSTAITLAMQRQLPAGHPIHAFSYVSEDRLFSEERFVDLVRGVVTHKVTPSAREFEEDIDDLIATQDFPFISLSVYAQYRVFQLAQQHGIKVLLDGQGADEIFCGYPSHLPPRLASLVQSGDIYGAWKLYAAIDPGWRTSRRWILGATFARMFVDSTRWPAFLSSAIFYPKWLNRDWFSAHDSRPILRPLTMSDDSLYNDIRSGITDLSLPQLLRYEDRNSMHFSIESRVPFCNHKLVEYATRLPARLLVSDTGVTKYILKEALSDLVPDDIRTRTKLGFVATDSAWLTASSAWVEARLSYARSAQVDCLAMNNVQEFVRSAVFGSGQWNPAVWRILNLLAWSEQNAIDWH